MVSEETNFQAKLYRRFVEEGLDKDFREFKEKLYKGWLQPKKVIF